MLQPATCGFCTHWIDGSITFFDAGDLAVDVNNKGRTVRDPHLRNQNSVLFADFTHVIAQHREFSFQLGFFPMFQRGSEICADGEDLNIHSIELSDTSLVRQHFLRSTTGERRGEEG